MNKKTGLMIFLYGMVMGAFLFALTFFILERSDVIQIQGLSNGPVSKETQKAIEEKSKTILQCIDTYYLDQVDEQAVADGVYKGIVNGLGDKYAAYYNKEEYEKIKETHEGTFYGIGAYVGQKKDTGQIYIVSPMKDGPAEKAGIQSGDIIYAVDDKSTKGMELSGVIELVHGKKGSKVKLTLLHNGDKTPVEITVVRDKVEVDTVDSVMLTDSIGYIQVTTFDSVTPSQFSKRLAELENKGMKGLIVDLRDNGGGVLDGAVSMIDRMLPKGIATYTLDKYKNKKVYYLEDDVQIQVPVAILVNENTASASELFSGALQDAGKAVLVGTTTYGKGIVQSFIDLDDGSTVKLTTSKYYTPKGRNIHGTGLKPDIEVKLDLSTLGKDTPDNQMQKAMDYLKEKVSH